MAIAAMAVSGAGTSGAGAGAGSIALNWVRNDVRATLRNIGDVAGVDDEVYAGGNLNVSARDESSINSLAGAIAIAGFGAAPVSGAVGASVAYNYLGGDPNDPASTTHNRVEAAILGRGGRLK